MPSNYCRRCHQRWAQRRGLCRRCEREERSSATAALALEHVSLSPHRAHVRALLKSSTTSTPRPIRRVDGIEYEVVFDGT